MSPPSSSSASLAKMERSSSSSPPTTTSSSPSKSPSRPAYRRRLSVTDLVDPTKPWMLIDGTDMLGFFDFVPRHLRMGPWSVTASLSLFAIIYTLVIVMVGANHKYNGPAGGVLDDFRLPTEAYQAYTVSWWYNLSAFVWCSFVLYMVKVDSHLGSVAWVSYTLWSWSLITVRNGLCVLAPFLPAVGVVAEMMRLPVLLAASITFGVWNFILMPAICLVFIKDVDRRWKFLQFAFGFRLFNLHVLDIVFALLNAAYTEPRRQLHLGDLNAIAIYMTVYMVFYYFVLDRFGMHLYPIFSPRVAWVVFSWAMIIGLCVGGYHFWKGIMEDSPF